MGWELCAGAEISATLISRFVRPAVRAVPPVMARQIGFCRVRLAGKLDGRAVASRWTDRAGEVEIEVAAGGREDHDAALELLLCLGQVLWTRLSGTQQKAYWLLLDGELRAGTPGEIDEDALRHKRALLAGHYSAASDSRLEHYGAASFAGTAAEYVHSLWHDVSVRPGPDFLPPRELRRRFELLSRWYPPAPGYRLFPRE